LAFGDRLGIVGRPRTARQCSDCEADDHHGGHPTACGDARKSVESQIHRPHPFRLGSRRAVGTARQPSPLPTATASCAAVKRMTSNNFVFWAK
jgi:hypothetical protein